MTSTSPTDRGPSPEFSSHPSFLCGRWLPHDQMSVSVHDSGFRQGVTIVERLRTYRGNVFALDAHLNRWQHSATTLGIEGLPARRQLASLVHELLAKNSELLRSESDLGITLFATPGCGGGQGATFGMHLTPLDHARNRRRRETGQPLVITAVKQQDPDCWPRAIKVRCRLHYYLADRIARQQHPEAVGVLVDHDRTVTETSIANLAIVEAGQIVSPLAEQVLPGITQGIVQRLAGEASFAWTTQRISAARLAAADEILMMGTDTGVWFAKLTDSGPFDQGKPGPIVCELQRRFQELSESAGAN